MGEILMQKGQVLSLKVTSHRLKKPFVKDNHTIYFHDVFVEDKQGNTSRKEYKSRYETLPPDTFVLNVWQNIRCTYPDPKGDEIEPYDSEAQRMEVARTAASGNPLPHGTGDNPTPVFAPNKTESARMLSMCMAYSKDILVAEVSKRKAGSQVTEDDIQKMIGWATKMHGDSMDLLSM